MKEKEYKVTKIDRLESIEEFGSIMEKISGGFVKGFLVLAAISILDTPFLERGNIGFFTYEALLLLLAELGGYALSSFAGKKATDLRLQNAWDQAKEEDELSLYYDDMKALEDLDAVEYIYTKKGK